MVSQDGYGPGYLQGCSSVLRECLRLHQASQTQIAPRAKCGIIKQPDGGIMTLTQQWRYLNFRNRVYISFPAKGIVRYTQIICSRLYIRLKGTCSLGGLALLNTSQ